MGIIITVFVIITIKLIIIIGFGVQGRSEFITACGPNP